MVRVSARYVRGKYGPRKFGGRSVLIVHVDVDLIEPQPRTNSEREPRKARPRWRQLELPLDFSEDGREP